MISCLAIVIPSASRRRDTVQTHGTVATPTTNVSSRVGLSRETVHCEVLQAGRDNLQILDLSQWP